MLDIPHAPWPGKGKEPDTDFYIALGDLFSCLGQGPEVFRDGLLAFTEAMLVQGYIHPPE